MSIKPIVLFSFDTPWLGTIFTLDDPVRGLLDSATYVLSGDIPVDLSTYVHSVSITRGRQSEFDEFAAGTASIVLRNDDRRFDPAYTSGPYYGNIVRGKRVQIQSNSGRPLLTGIVDDWDFDYSVAGESIATATIVDGLSNLAALKFDAWVGTVSQATGTRISAVLDRPEVGYPVTRNIGTGVSTMAADSIAAGTNVLEYLQTLARAEVGRVFDSNAGLLTFRDRHYVPLHLATSVQIDDATGTRFNKISRQEGKQTVRNWVKATLTSGATDTASDAASIAANGISPLQLDNLPLETTSQASDLTDFLVSAYATPTTRFDSVSFSLRRLSDAQADALCALDIGDPVAIGYTPDGIGSQVAQVCVVEGFHHDIECDPAEHTITLFLSRAEQTSLFILDDATYGLLDGVGLLAF